MKLLSEKSPIEVFQTASKLLYDAVAHTLGPSGSNTAVVYGKDVQANPKFQIINDGKTIIDNLTSPEAEVACALQTIRESVLSTNNIAGDGTTSTIIMIYSLLKELAPLLNEYSSFEVCRQLKNIKKEIYKILPQITYSLGTEITISQIAETSLGANDYVSLFEEAYSFAGKDGEVLLEKSDKDSPSLEKIDGVSLNQIGFIPELAVDDIGNIKKELNACDTIILKGDIKAFTSISNLLIKYKNSEKPLLMFYDRMTTDAFKLIAQNLVMKKEYNVYPISLEGYGDKILRYMTLLATMTNGKIIEITSNIDYNDVNIYGKIDGAIFNKDALIIKPCIGRLLEINKYIKENDFHIATKTVIVKAGSSNSIALEEQYRRFEDAIHSCSNAVKYGVCLGGGLSYIQVANNLIDTPLAITGAIINAFYSIYKHLLINCGVEFNESNISLPKIDEETGIYNLDEKYIIYDSYKTTEQVLINSIDMVHSIISTKILVCDPQR